MKITVLYVGTSLLSPLRKAEAEINARAAREAYGVGAIDFSTLVAASVDWRTFRSEYADRLAAVGKDRAELQMASGLPLLPGTPGQENDHESP